MRTIDPGSEPPAEAAPPAEANTISPVQPAASSPSAPAEQPAEVSAASALAQDAQSPDTAGSQSVPLVVDGQSEQSSGSAVDQTQPSAETVSNSTALMPAEPPKDSVATGLPALVDPTAQLRDPHGTNSAKLKRGRQFQPGQSGNLRGRPKGSRNEVTKFIESLIEGQGEALGATAVQKALDGDSALLREMLHRLAPRRGDRIELDLPKIVTATDARRASTAVIDACIRSEISPDQALKFQALLDTHVRLAETADLEPRVTALESERERKNN
jgi:Family of unknown function (DUF5681)